MCLRVSLHVCVCACICVCVCVHGGCLMPRHHQERLPCTQCPYAFLHTDRHRQAQADTDRQTNTHTHTHTHTHTLSLSLSLSLSLCLSLFPWDHAGVGSHCWCDGRLCPRGSVEGAVSTPNATQTDTGIDTDTLTDTHSCACVHTHAMAHHLLRTWQLCCFVSGIWQGEQSVAGARGVGRVAACPQQDGWSHQGGAGHGQLRRHSDPIPCNRALLTSECACVRVCVCACVRVRITHPLARSLTRAVVPGQLHFRPALFFFQALVPLVFGFAVYSLMYTPHRSWFSWAIASLANGA